MKGRSIAEVLTGAVVILAAAGFLAFAVVQGGRVPVGGGGIDLSARFDAVDGLNPGADVRIAGVRVGSVTAIRIVPETFQAEVTLRVPGDLRLPVDSSAEITSEGLLGGRYVSLMPGGDERLLGPGGRITETQGSISLESLLGRFIFSVTQMNAGGGNGAAQP